MKINWQKIGLKNKISTILLSLLVLLTIGNMLVYGSQKQGYHVDEIYSYGLSNSAYLPFMHFGTHDYNVKEWMEEYGPGNSLGDLFSNLWKDFQILREHDFRFSATPIYEDYIRAQANSADTRTTTWVSGQAYKDYLAASADNRFNYASVYYNQRGDVHPPFFYLLLHTISSVFSGTFSKWFGIGLNMVFLIATLLVLYRMSERHLGGKWVALAVTTAYALSCGFMTTAMYIRMYAMLTFFVVLSTYLAFEAVSKDFKLRKREWFAIGAVTFLGYLTHYYYVIFAVALAAVLLVWMLIRKHFRSMLAYCITMASSAIIGICLWPFSIRHVFFGYRGQGSFEALKESEAYAIRFKLMWDQMAHAMLGKTKVVAGILLLLGLVLLLVVAIQKRRAHEKCSQTAGNLALLLIPGLFYVMIVSQIVPFFADRYVMCAFPFVVLIVIYVIYEGVRAVSARWTYGKYASAAALVLVSAVLIAGNHYGSNTPGYLFPVGQETVVLPENTDCVYVLADGEWNQSATDTSILAQCRQVGVVYEPYVDVLKEGYRCESGDSLLIYVQNGLDTEGVARHVQDTLGVAGLKEITRYYGGTACGILFSKE